MAKLTEIDYEPRRFESPRQTVASRFRQLTLTGDGNAQDEIGLGYGRHRPRSWQAR